VPQLRNLTFTKRLRLYRKLFQVLIILHVFVHKPSNELRPNGSKLLVPNLILLYSNRVPNLEAGEDVSHWR
jgi:hypothetical protein